MPAKPLNEKTKKALRDKAEGTRFTYGELAQVYRRGQGAYLSSGSRNVSMAAWAMGRVNSYMSGKGGARKADADIYKKSRGKSNSHSGLNAGYCRGLPPLKS